MEPDGRILQQCSDPDAVGLAAAWRKHAMALHDLVRLVVPMAATMWLNCMADRYTLAFVGHWDFQNRAHYDGAGIGKMYSNITGLSLGVSATFGIATFCSQAHGAGQARELSPVIFRRAMFLVCFVFCFTATAAIFAESLLSAAGQPADVAKTSAYYAQVQTIGVPFFWVTSAINACLNCTKRTFPGLLASMVSSGTQIVMTIALMHPQLLNMGYLGMALGRSLSGIVSVTTLVTYVKCRGLEDVVWNLQPHSERVLDVVALKAYLKVSIPNAIIVWSEWWAFEGLSLFVGYTPDAKVNLAAHGTMFNIIVVVYMTWTGTSNAVCTLVGNLLGARQNQDIRPMLHVTCLFSLSTAIFFAVCYEAGKSSVAAMFTEDPVVRAAICSSSLGVVLSIPFYAQLMSFYGVLRAANKQSHGVIATCVGYWIIGLPFGYILGCRWHWPTPLLGVWLGNVIALFVASSWVLLAVFVCIDWLSVKRLTGP